MYLYETHMHTHPVSACAMVSPQEQVSHYKSRGYVGIIVTDHFVNGNCGCPPKLTWEQKMRFFADGYEKAKAEGKKQGLDVFFGLEYTLDGSDFLIYGLTVEYLISQPGFACLEIAELSSNVRNAGGYIAQAHPYRDAYWVSNPEPVNPKFLDGLEVYNASMPKKLNNRALQFAKTHNLAQQAGTDSHIINTFPPKGISLKKRAESIHDIINALKSGQAELVV